LEGFPTLMCLFLAFKLDLKVDSKHQIQLSGCSLDSSAANDASAHTVPFLCHSFPLLVLCCSFPLLVPCCSQIYFLLYVACAYILCMEVSFRHASWIRPWHWLHLHDRFFFSSFFLLFFSFSVIYL
jgi:hypothetical protein